jgi:sialate O-acetylesterase
LLEETASGGNWSPGSGAQSDPEARQRRWRFTSRLPLTPRTGSLALWRIMNLPSRLTFSLTCALAAAASVAQAELKLPPMFSDNMVLQREQPVRIWGWDNDGVPVVVKFRGQTVKTTTANLAWQLALKPLKPGGPDTLTISTPTQTITYTNVLVGDVWVCSGQSNMEWPLKSAFNPEPDLASATNSRIRLFKVPKSRTDTPTSVIKSAWEVCTPQGAEGFSAVGYYFGRDLERDLNVPIGLIGTYWGGTPAESWMSRDALEINPRYVKEILEPSSAAVTNWKKSLEAWQKEKAEAEKAGTAFNKRAPGQPWGGFELYNGMIAPLLPFTIKGAIWYQGESNSGRAEQYRTLFADMIRNWRRDWGQGDFPFLLVQLAPFKDIQSQPGESSWAELREAQLLATQVLPKVGMAVITDVGEEKDIHPRKKQPVGARLALAARSLGHGQKVAYSGPVYRSSKTDGNRIVLRFDHVGKGLEARDGELKGFAVCGEDRKWVWAKAEILLDNTIAVSSPEVAQPVAVRFGWADFPVVNLWNKDGLPATPFRTDDFPLTTVAK